jgi:hypothetical protein
MTTWDEIVSDGEALIERVESLVSSERWDELSTTNWSIGGVPSDPLTDTQRERILALMGKSSQLCRDVAARMSSAQTNIEGMPMLRRASTAYLANVTM